MDFSLLPDPVFLQIFQYLPLEDCIRSSRVNKIFRRIAQLATSHTKSLDFNERRFQYLNADQFAVILDLCAPNLERIKFPSRDVLRNFRMTFKEYLRRAAALEDHGQQLASIFHNYECPRLTDIDLGYAPIDFTHFDRLVRNNPKMESFAWRSSFVGFPNITSNSLKILNLLIVNDASLQSLIGRCPNLQEIDLKMRGITANVMDEFFASVPQLHRVSLDNQEIIKLERPLVNFWNLPLTSFRVSFFSYDYPGDNLFNKVATSFPHLQNFHFRCLVELTDTGIACLGDLQELEAIELQVSDFGHTCSWYDQGIRQLASCKKLRKFGIGSSYISSGSFVHLLRSCPQLEEISFWGIIDVDFSEEVAVILESLAGIPKRDIAIKFGVLDETVCDSEPVKMAIKMLEENGGVKIKMSCGQWLPQWPE